MGLTGKRERNQPADDLDIAKIEEFRNAFTDVAVVADGFQVSCYSDKGVRVEWRLLSAIRARVTSEADRQGEQRHSN